MKDSKQLSKGILIVNVVLGIAVAILYVLYITDNINADQPKEVLLTANDSIDYKGKIAIVNTDSLLMNYELSNDLNEELIEKQKQAEAQLQMKLSSFEKKYAAFQEKARLGSFLSQASAEAQQNQILQEQQQLQMLQEKLRMDLMRDQTDLNIRLLDSVKTNIEIINNGRFDIILGDNSGANILHANGYLDITSEVLDFLNERYISKDEEVAE